MSRIVLPRRNFLRGLGGVSLAMPLLSSLGCSSEEQRAIERTSTARQRTGDGFPKRFVFVYTPNGNYDTPNASYPGYWQELAPLADKITLINGLDLNSVDDGPGEPHQRGMALLTGRRLNTGAFVGGDGSLAGWASGISIDQEIANGIGVMTQRKTLNLGVQSTNYGGTEVRTVLSYLGSDTPVANETNPWSVFDELFAGLGSDPGELARLRARRKSVLDVVGRRYETLSQKVSASDRVKIEQHLTAVREVEQRLDATGGVIGGSCQKPEITEAPAQIEAFLGDPTNFGTIGRMQMDLACLALACDLTRVVTLQWSAATNNRPYPFLEYDGAPIVGDEHVLGHMPDEDLVSWGKLAVIRRWNLQNLRYFLEKLDAIPEGEGTMLDNTVVVLGSEIARGNTHSHSDQHFVVAGGAGGALKTGQFLEYAGERSHNDLLLTLLLAMGIDATSFGNPDYCTGPLGELLA